MKRRQIISEDILDVVDRRRAAGEGTNTHFVPVLHARTDGRNIIITHIFTYNRALPKRIHRKLKTKKQSNRIVNFPCLLLRLYYNIFDNINGKQISNVYHYGYFSIYNLIKTNLHVSRYFFFPFYLLHFIQRFDR